MFTRSELESKTLEQLRDLCFRYGLKPTGNRGYKPSYITTLMAFPYLALQQMRDGRGLKSPGLIAHESVYRVLDELGELTSEQSALVKATLEGKTLGYPERYEQERLLNLYKAQMLLEQVISLLNQ